MDDGYYDLGGHSFAVTTSSPAAQTWFDRGLAWCYGLNHEEAIVSFENALAADAAAAAVWSLVVEVQMTVAC